jgi:hypothetical protein
MSRSRRLRAFMVGSLNVLVIMVAGSAARATEPTPAGSPAASIIVPADCQQ